MDIYKARQLQKKLFEYSNLEFRRMRIMISSNGRVFYTIIHRVSDIGALTFNEEFLKRIKISMDLGAVVEVRNISEEYAESVGIPSGLYVGEKIEID